MRTNKTWVIVAENSRARIFAMDAINLPLRELDDLTNPEGRLQERELVSDRPGRTFDSQGAGRHSKAPSVEKSRQVSIEFARILSRSIEEGRVQGQFERLILIAPPRFLGALRQQLDKSTHRLITKEIQKNIVREDEAAIRDELRI
jgi:protein required for attachment to host cells